VGGKGKGVGQKSKKNTPARERLFLLREEEPASSACPTTPPQNLDPVSTLGAHLFSVRIPQRTPFAVRSDTARQIQLVIDCESRESSASSCVLTCSPTERTRWTLWTLSLSSALNSSVPDSSVSESVTSRSWSLTVGGLSNVSKLSGAFEALPGRQVQRAHAQHGKAVGEIRCVGCESMTLQRETRNTHPR